MNYFIATLGPKLFSNWAICKENELWGIVGRGTNWGKNANALAPGDRVFIWRGGQPNGFIAEIEAQERARFLRPPNDVPWPNPGWFGAVFRMSVIREVNPPLSDRFPNENGRFAVRYGFNNTVLQHIFEQISSDVAVRISDDFRIGRTSY